MKAQQWDRTDTPYTGDKQRISINRIRLKKKIVVLQVKDLIEKGKKQNKTNMFDAVCLFYL